MNSIMPEVTTSTELKELILQGWELWYLADTRFRLPGSWEMRYKAQYKAVPWRVVEMARRNMDWFLEHTSEAQIGSNWVYSLKQRNFLGTI